MIPTFLDFETAYSREYSLSKMTTAEYVLNPAFEILCCAIKEGVADTSRTYWGDDAENYLRSLDWSQRFLVSHNIRFDGAVLAWRLGLRPRMYGCTMAMGDALISAHTGSASLRKIAEALGLPPKGDEVLHAMGKWRRDFSPDEARRYMNYCARDNDLCAEIFKMLAAQLPREEFGIIDDLARMFIDPVIQLDVPMLQAYLSEIEAAKENLLFACGMTDRKQLMSNTQFAEALTRLGAIPPTKTSPTTGNTAYAFAKTDEEFIELADSDNPQIAALVAARLGHKSTIEETRTKQFIATGFLTPQAWCPVPLRYAAALTHRFGGTDKTNFQNLRRVDTSDPKKAGRLRRSMKAPPGYVFVTADASQIELRLLMWQAGQTDALEVMAAGKSLYLDYGHTLFGRPITKAEVEPYTLAKISVLSSGYGVGAVKFRRTAALQSGGLVKITEDMARETVKKYRRRFFKVPELWQTHERWLPLLAGMQYEKVKNFGETYLELIPSAIRGPSQLCMIYRSLRQLGDGSYCYVDRQGFTQKIYGSKITENVTQHLARVVVCQAQGRVRGRTGLRPSGQAHDELIYCIPEAKVPELVPVLREEMSRTPAWAPNLPLSCEVKIGLRYGELEVQQET